MNAIIAFDQKDHLPAYLSRRKELAAINQEAAKVGGYPHLSIKGKVWTLVKDGQRKIIRDPRDEDVVLQHIHLAVLRANTKARAYYEKDYVEGESDNQLPDCYSMDGVAPAADARNKQCNTCAGCPQAVWGAKVSKDGGEAKGTPCAPQTRLVVSDPDRIDPDNLLLLRVPPASRKGFFDIVALADSKSVPYNAMVLKVGFDPEAASPKLTYRPVGWLSDDAYAQVQSLYDSDQVRDMLGLKAPAAAPAPVPAPAPAPVQAAPVQAAPAPVQEFVQASPAVEPAPVVQPAPVVEAPAAKPARTRAKAAAPAPAPAPVAAAPAEAQPTNMIDDLDSLLGSLDI